MTETSFAVSGMTCGTCAEKVAKVLRAQKGVHSVDASFVMARVVVKHDPSVISVDAIKKAIEELGYEAAEMKEDAGHETVHVNWSQIALTAALGTVLVVAWVLELTGMGAPWFVHALGAFVAVVGGFPIASKAVRAALHRELSVDALVTTAAVGALVIGNYVEAGVVVFILLLGELLEEITIAKTSKAIRGLGALLPDTVNVKRGGVESEIPVSEVVVGDILVVRPGERIAVDGVVVSGDGAVDQSPITGEPIPVEKIAGDEVYSGSLNQIGALEVRATKVGKETTVARIKAMISEAQGRKAGVQRLVDRFATYFVPTMLVIAVLVYLATGDVQRAITVLIVACPCAFVLGTPTAVVAAIGAAARRGIIIRGGDVLESLGKINGVVFDKTGTLTRGVPCVVDVKRICGHSEKEIMTFAAVAEKLSEHPLAGAILDKASEWELLITAPADFKVTRGRGVEVRHDGLRIILGNRELLAANTIALPPEAEAYMQEREHKGETVLIVTHDKDVCGLIALADPIREEAPEVVGRLKASGIHEVVAMYTGDNHRTASSVAATLGIDEVAAGLLPEDKVARVKELCGKGHSIAMVGDGINDAPALATATVGIAMGKVGSDIAMQAANVVLLTDDLAQVPTTLALGRKALNVIRQNLIFALVFNTTMVFLASEGHLSMAIGALCHQGSSLFVILNSMRLLLFSGWARGASRAAGAAFTGGKC